MLYDILTKYTFQKDYKLQKTLRANNQKLALDKHFPDRDLQFIRKRRIYHKLLDYSFTNFYYQDLSDTDFMVIIRKAIGINM